MQFITCELILAYHFIHIVSAEISTPFSKVHEANMGLTWVLSAPDGLHGGAINLAIRD